MIEKEIKRYHEELFIFLMAQSEEDPSFRFRVRQRGEDRFGKGYWFGGNNDYLETSFWSSSDYTHMTPIIRLCFSYDSKEWYVSLVARDSIKRQEYFKAMAEKFEYLVTGKYDTIWEKKLESKAASDWLSPLKNFINADKKDFDDYLQKKKLTHDTNLVQETEATELFDDLGNTKDWVIPIDKFQKNIKAIQLWRNHLAENERLEALNPKSFTNDCAISRISINNFQGIKELVIENLPLDAQWIFLTGENAFGKTSVLRAIAKGLVGDEDFVAPLPNEAKIFLNAVVYKKIFRYSAKTKTKPDTPVPVAAYGVSRFHILSLEQEESERSKESTYSLFHDNGQLMNIERLLIDAERDDKPLFNKLKSIFKAIIPSLADIQSKKENKVRRIRYQEKSENGDTYEPVLLNELAAGYRGVLTMIGDMVMRLYENKNNKLDDLKGIVLIDEIDAHLHPKYQYELPYLLSKVFPKVQFIVTTHSPIPILGLPKNIKPVVLTVERNLEDGITIDRKDDDFDIRKLNPEALLTSPIFNFQTLFARGATADEIIPTSDFNEVLELEQIKKELMEMRKKGLVK